MELKKNQMKEKKEKEKEVQVEEKTNKGSGGMEGRRRSKNKEMMNGLLLKIRKLTTQLKVKYLINEYNNPNNTLEQ